MVTLAGFPIVSQLTTVTGDGRPSENAQYDCVAACVDAMCRYWLNTPENSVFNPDHFKDAAYGENWRNDGTDAARYVDFCRTLGISLAEVTTQDANHAISTARKFIEGGIPVTFTEADPYVDASLGWTHACCFFAEDANGLTALDPYIGKPLYKSDTAWASVLRSNQLWIAERRDQTMIPNGWRDANNVLYSPSHIQGGQEVPITGPFRDYILANAWRPSDRAIEVGHHVNELEYSNPSLGAGFRQQFLWSLLEMPDGGSFAGKVIYAWSGVEGDYLRQQYEAQLAEIATLKAELAKPVIDPNSVANRLQSIELEAQNIIKLATSPV